MIIGEKENVLIVGVRDSDVIAWKLNRGIDTVGTVIQLYKNARYMATSNAVSGTSDGNSLR